MNISEFGINEALKLVPIWLIICQVDSMFSALNQIRVKVMKLNVTNTFTTIAIALSYFS